MLDRCARNRPWGLAERSVIVWATAAIALALLGAASADARADEPDAVESDASASEGDSASNEPVDGSPPAPDPVPSQSKVSREPAPSPERSAEPAQADDLAGMQMKTETEPITEAIIGGAILSSMGQAFAGTVAVTTYEFGLSCSLSLDSVCERDIGVPEAIVPLAGPFVALGRRRDLGVIHQVALGVGGGLQIVGLVMIVVGSTLQRSADASPVVSLDAGPQGAGLGVRVPW